MKKSWLIALALLVVLGLWLAQKTWKRAPAPVAAPQAQSASYWTCPMHPQIHADHPGECPICHMKLVQVKATPADDAAERAERAAVTGTREQMKLLGVQKEEVEKMDLRVKIPVSGRFLSAGTLAFQIYESDLRYVKPGLPFSGESSFYSDEPVAGTISSVDSIVDPTSRTVRVVGSVKKAPRGILPETGFRGQIELTLKDRVAVPESSVLRTGSGDLVYLFEKDNELSAKPVKLGIKAEGFYDVLEGLEPGQWISSGPNFLVDSEAKIRGVSAASGGGGAKAEKPALPACPKGQHWDIPMSMCMPGDPK